MMSAARLITFEEQQLLLRIAPRQHDWKNTDHGTPVCSHCGDWPDDPWVVVSGGWKSGQCWGRDGQDFVMRVLVSGIHSSEMIPPPVIESEEFPIGEIDEAGERVPWTSADLKEDENG